MELEYECPVCGSVISIDYGIENECPICGTGCYYDLFELIWDEPFEVLDD